MSKPRRTLMAFRFRPETVEKLRVAAKQENRSMTNYLEWIIDNPNPHAMNHYNTDEISRLIAKAKKTDIDKMQNHLRQADNALTADDLEYANKMARKHLEAVKKIIEGLTEK